MTTYTITGAADWPMLVTLVGFLGGGLGAVAIGMIGLMWKDLGDKFGGFKTDNDEEHKHLWNAIKECQDDCCPRGKQ